MPTTQENEVSPLFFGITLYGVRDWSLVQGAITNTSDNDVIDLSALSTPDSRVYTFGVGDNKTITLRGSATEIENVAFV